MISNNIYLGDAYELIKELPDKSIDLVVTDPPYEIVAGGSGGCFGARNRGYHKEYKNLGDEEHIAKGVTLGNRDNKNCTCVGFDYSLLDELDRVMKRINIYIWCNKKQVSSLMKHYEDQDCNVDLLVWVKTNPLPTCNNKYLSDLEYCVFARSKATPLNGSYKTKSKAWISGLNVDDKKDFGHPTIKPLERIKHYIINSSKQGDIVLDPFLGSGTTAVASKELGRRWVGFEINEDYFNKAKDRINGIKHNGEMSLFDTNFDLVQEQYEQETIFDKKGGEK